MRKYIYTILFAASVMGMLPTQASAAKHLAIEIIDNDFQNISITTSLSSVRVTGGNGQMMYVYNVTGVRIMSVRVDGMDKRFDLNLPKGCYIVKIGKAVRKISIR